MVSIKKKKYIYMRQQMKNRRIPLISLNNENINIFILKFLNSELKKRNKNRKILVVTGISK